MLVCTGLYRSVQYVGTGILLPKTLYVAGNRVRCRVTMQAKRCALLYNSDGIQWLLRVINISPAPSCGVDSAGL